MDPPPCVECIDVPSVVHCVNCTDSFCVLCFRWQHRRGRRALHQVTGWTTSGWSSTAVPAAECELVQPEAGTTEAWRANDAQAEATVDEAEIVQDDGEVASLPVVKVGDEVSAALRRLRARSARTPMRLSDEERVLLGILEGVLHTSEYTDHVDVSSSMGTYSFMHFGGRGTNVSKKPTRMRKGVEEVLSLLLGMYVAADYRRGKTVVGSDKRGDFFRRVFEIGRRYKIMNPDRMRTSYGKMMHLLQDTQTEVQLEVGSLVAPIQTVETFLADKGALDLLARPELVTATGAVGSTLSAAERTAAASAKAAARARLVADGKRGAFGSTTAEDVERVIDSISDAASQLEMSVRPVARMLDWLVELFDPNTVDQNAPYSTLGISAGSGGSKLTHTPTQHFTFVYQSLTLWKLVMAHLPDLWLAADSDLLAKSGYRLMNTGQGLHRVQGSPNVSKLMSQYLGQAKAMARERWEGLSVVHLGDRDVPNSLVFIDKYVQVPRMLAPLCRFVDSIDEMNRDPYRQYLVRSLDGPEMVKRRVLRDFFRHGFNGSGDDGGSCIDGRLTSAWNWTSNVSGKFFYAALQASGFTGFDGDSGDF